MGHEGFARVIEVGLGVRHVNPGDHVVLHWRPGAGYKAIQRHIAGEERP